MTDKEKQLGIILSQIADELNITPTMLEKAVSSYTSVGMWLSDGIPYDVKIMPQGSSLKKTSMMLTWYVF